MKTKLLRTFLAFTILSLFLMPEPAFAGKASPFVGHWQSIDVDGSDIRLTIGGPPNGLFNITWTESYISFCEGGPGIIQGSGWLAEGDPYVLEADLHVTCFTIGESLDFSMAWIYDQGTDTISSGFITWHRPSARSKACLPPPSGLTGWWPGDGDASDLIAGRNGAFHGEATTGSGLVNLAFWLDGEGDFINVPHDPALDVGTNDFTIDLWVNFNDTAGEQVLVEKWIQSDPPQGWTLTKLESDVLRLAMGDGQGVEVDLDSQSLSNRPGIWYHFAATRQGMAVTLYMNGEAIAYEPEMEVRNLSSTSSLKFGQRGSPEEAQFNLNGRIDEVELLVGTSLSADQILALYQAGSAGKCKDEDFRTPRLDLRVNYGHDWVESFYEAGHTIWITVTESDGVTVKATAEMFTEPQDFWGGETGFQTQASDWVPGPPDIQPYDRVFGRVDNGQTAHVQIGEISGEIDLEADSIQGTIYAPWFTSEVSVECHPWGSPEPVGMKFDMILPDGQDTYSCSWAGEWDIQPGQDVGVGYFSPDGNWVANAFRIDPFIWADPVSEYINGWNWPVGNNVTVNLFDPEDTLLYSAEQVAGPDNGVGFDVREAGFDMQAGYKVTMSDGLNNKELVISVLQITEINQGTHTISGIYDPNPNLGFWINLAGQEPENLVFEESSWIATFTELTPGAWGEVAQPDEDGDMTGFSFNIPN